MRRSSCSRGQLRYVLNPISLNFFQFSCLRLMWFKLLFVPTLGIIILTLFLLEDYCYSLQQKAEDESFNSRELGSSTQSQRSTFWQRNNRLRSSYRGNQRITLVDDKGVGHCYQIESSITMRELLQYYCDRNSLDIDSVVT